MERARVAALGVAVSVLAARPATCQTRLEQDALDLQARSNVFQGAGARAYGMGGAFLARPDDATAASWNPAGLSYLRSPEMSIVGTFTSLRIVQKDISEIVRRNERLAGTAPDFLAASSPVTLGSLTGAVQLGYQRVIPFDGERRITSFDQRGDLERVREFSTLGGFDVIALAAGLQLTRELRFGLSLNHWTNGYSYASDRTVVRPSSQTTEFAFSGWNFNLGGIWSPIEQLNLGAVYKTAFSADVDLERSRTDAPTPNFPTASSNSYRRTDVRLDFPSAFGLGASWRPLNELTLSADYTRTNWSEGRIHNYFTLPREDEPDEPDDVFPVLPYPQLTPNRSQGDAEQLRAGAEYVVIAGRLKWPFRIGYFADRQLEKRFDDYFGRERRPTYHGFTAGTGLVLGPVLFDVAYMFEKGAYRASDIESNDPLPRDTEVRSHRVFVSLIFRDKR